MKKIAFLSFTLLFLNCIGNAQEKNMDNKKNYEVNKTEAEWQEELTPEQYWVLREKGTERPHTGKYNMHFEDGTYKCAGCNQELFESDSKFKSDCGWPSFDKSIQGSIDYILDKSHGMVRTEIVCSNCGGHIGHIFNDGPTETGKRYCVNSVSVDFEDE